MVAGRSDAAAAAAEPLPTLASLLDGRSLDDCRAWLEGEVAPFLRGAFGAEAARAALESAACAAAVAGRGR